MSKGNGVKAAQNVVLIPPSEIVETFDPRYDAVPQETIDWMDGQFQSVGQLQEVIVRKNDTGAYEIVDGRTRLKTGLQIEKRDSTFRLRAHVVDIDENEAYEQAVIANVCRSEATDMDRATGMKHFLDIGWTKDRVARFFGVSETDVNNKLQLLTLHPELQDAVNVGAVPSTTAIAAAKLPEETQAEVGKKAKAANKAAKEKAEKANASVPKGNTKKAEVEARKAERERKREDAATKREAKRVIKEAARVAKINSGNKSKGVADIRALLSDRKNQELPGAILKYFSGDIEDDDLIDVIDRASEALRVTAEEEEEVEV